MYLYLAWYPVRSMDGLSMQWQADVTFYMASAYKNGQNFPILMLGTGSGDWIIVKNQDLS
jgi:hypothetical protein